MRSVASPEDELPFGTDRFLEALRGPHERELIKARNDAVIRAGIAENRAERLAADNERLRKTLMHVVEAVCPEGSLEHQDIASAVRALVAEALRKGAP